MAEYGPINDYMSHDKGGRPSKYKPEYAEQAYFLIITGTCRNDNQLAIFFKVDRATLFRWKHEREDFRNKWQEAWDKVNVDGVEVTLLKRAQGFSYTETTRERVKVPAAPVSDGEEIPEPKFEMVVTKKVKKMVVPDVKAQELILRNRSPKRWPKAAADMDIKAPLTVHIHTEPKEGE